MVPQRMFGMTPWVRRLIVANLIVFLLQMTIFVNPWFVATFGFAPLDALARPWTFVTYTFIHANFLHLAFNLLALFVFGFIKGRFTGTRPLRSALQTALIGSLAAGAAFLIARAIS